MVHPAGHLLQTGGGAETALVEEEVTDRSIGE
jgi:hypothetical protein